MKNWTDEELDFLKEHYPLNGARYCSEKLERTESAINRKCSQLKIEYNWIRPNWHQSNLEKYLLNSQSFTDMALRMGLAPAGSNIKTIKKYVKLYGLDTSHFLTRSQLSEKGLIKNKKWKPLSEILVNNSTFSTTHLKNRLYKEGIKNRFCEKCGQGEMWHGEKISLILDHINGNHYDNRLNNLQILCPNCNATLDTHCKKNQGKYKVDKSKESLIIHRYINKC